MSYEIYFGRAEEEQEPVRLAPGQREAWERIVRRVGREAGPVGREELSRALVLRREEPSCTVRLDYRRTSASISIPYRYPGHLALPVITEAYRIAAIVEEETGLAGYDPEGGRRVCAVCGTAVRGYQYRIHPARSPMYERCTGLAWCSACRIYGASVVQVPRGKVLVDVLAALPDEQQERLRRSELALVQYLARHELGEVWTT